VIARDAREEKRKASNSRWSFPLVVSMLCVSAFGLRALEAVSSVGDASPTRDR